LKPKTSIITVNFNNLVGLKKTLDSVFNQTFKDFEYIVIDGGSTDGSTEYLERESRKIDYYISEPDSGVYNAMNKGMEKAKGDYIIFLNSGDHFFNKKVLEQSIQYLDNKDLVYFNLEVIEGGKAYTKKYPDMLSFSYFVKDTLPHPATFIKKEALIKYGPFDETMKIAADWKFFIDGICKYNLSYQRIDNTLTTFYLDGMSSNPKNRKIIFNEKQYHLKQEYPAYLRDIDDILVKNDKLNSLRNSKIIKLLVKLGFLNKF